MAAFGLQACSSSGAFMFYTVPHRGIVAKPRPRRGSPLAWMWVLNARISALSLSGPSALCVIARGKRMLIGVKGKKSPSPRGIADLLLECHDRIRSFVGMARRLAEAKDAPGEQVQDAAGQVRRYFEEALPLHVQDEEESLLPRLRGQDPVVDAALDKMHAEHGAHERPLAELVRLCRKLADSPEQHADMAQDLSRVVAELDRAFSVHLRNEEETIIPAIGRRLSPAEQEAMVAELRQRRAPPAE